jgi:hypothetical protein
MKYIFNIFLSLLFFNTCYSQNTKNNLRENKEIKEIFKYFANKKLDIPIYYNLDKSKLTPSHLISFREFYLILKNDGNWTNFTPSKSKNLNLHDCIELNNYISNDTNKLCIQEDWIKSNNIRTLPDPYFQNQEKSIEKFVKPVFFRNYTRCFIAFIYSEGINSFFLKKINNKWVFDKYFLVIAI